MKKIIIATILIIIFLPLFFFFHSLRPKEEAAENFLFSIERGEGIASISRNLEKEGLVRSSYSFIIYNILKGTRKSLQAGDYFLSPSMSVSEIAKKLAEGETAKETITIIEGWKLEDIKEYLKEKKICEDEEFLSIVNEDLRDEFSFLADKPKEASLEGYLFPDTYRIRINSSCREAVFLMLDNFSQKIEDLEQEIAEKGKTVFEIVTMASLIEKEVRTLEDKKLVSGLLWKRIGIGMPLQVDATISYVTGRRTTRISLDELKIESPYNTYLYRGLPVGPISNPGIESIIAALRPVESEFFFYLSAPDSTTIFSRNLEEHNMNKAKYLK